MLSGGFIGACGWGSALAGALTLFLLGVFAAILAALWFARQIDGPGSILDEPPACPAGPQKESKRLTENQGQGNLPPGKAA